MATYDWKTSTTTPYSQGGTGPTASQVASYQAPSYANVIEPAIAPNVARAQVQQAIAGVGIGAGAGVVGPVAPPVDPNFPPIVPAVVGAGLIAGANALFPDWFGNLWDWLTPGGDPSGGYVNGVPLQGPGLAEPPPGMIAKEWNTGTAQFYLLIDGRIAVYSKKKRRWKVYRPQKHIVVPRNPRIGTLLRADIRTDRLMAKIGKRVRRVTKRVTMVKG